MAVTLATIIQDVVDELGLPRPTSIIASESDNIRRLLAMCNREGRELAEERDWTILTKVHTFTTVASQEEYSLPEDYLRLRRDTEWDRTQGRPLYGPINSVTWQSIKSSNLGTGVAFSRYRIMKSESSLGRTMRIEPVPSTSGDVLAYEYISSFWCADSGKTEGQSAWNADTDEPIVDADLLRLGTLVRFKRSMGFEYGSEADEYARMFQRKAGQDRPSPTLHLSSERRLRLIGPWDVPETGYG